MMTEVSPRESTNPLFILAIGTCIALGFTVSPLFFPGTFVFVGLTMMQSSRQKRVGMVIAGIGAVLFAISLAYSIGKDLALRDNAKLGYAAVAESKSS